MSMNDTLSNALSKIRNAEEKSKGEVIITPASRIIIECLNVMNKHMYIGEAKEGTHASGKMIDVILLGRINKCGAVKPRFYVKLKDIEKFEKRYLPSKDFGILILSTSSGIITHKEAKEKGIGGRILAYCY